MTTEAIEKGKLEARADAKKTQKNARKKRRKISKHVLNAQKEKGGTAQPTTKGKKKKKKIDAHVKDPSDVYGYLTSWKKNQQDEASEWKFNKNTQSWLLRHMYEFDKIPKGTFVLLLEYLKGLKGEHTKTRVLLDARMKVIRYKKYEEEKKLAEKNSIEDTRPAGDEEEDDDDDNAGKDMPKAGSESDSKTQQDADQEADTTRWNKLDDHGKRKEYKRARKVLELFSE